MDSWMFLMLCPFIGISHMFKLYKCGPWKPIGNFFQVKLLWIGFCLDEIIYINTSTQYIVAIHTLHTTQIYKMQGCRNFIDFTLTFSLHMSFVKSGTESVLICVQHMVSKGNIFK